MKYYITNGNRFINAGGNHRSKDVIENCSRKASRFKYSDGITYMMNHCKNEPDWNMQRIVNGSTYANVITTANRFVGASNSVTDKLEHARQFDSVQEAKDYLNLHKDISASFKNTYIVDSTLTSYDYTKPVPRVSVEKDIRRAVYERSGGKCRLCGRPVSFDKFTVDHIVPLARGGENKIANYQCTCFDCNQIKGSRLDSEMYEGISSIMSKLFYEEPTSEQAAKIIRGIVRGYIHKYSLNPEGV